MASYSYPPTTIISDPEWKNWICTSSPLHLININVWLLAEKCWIPQRKKLTIKLTPTIRSTTFNCWCKCKKNPLCEHKFLSLVSNFLFNLPVYIAPTVCIIWSSCWVILKWLLEMVLIQRTHYQLPKLLQLCEFPEWASSTEAGNVSVNMKLDFNDFNSTEFMICIPYLINLLYRSVWCFQRMFSFISASERSVQNHFERTRESDWTCVMIKS